MRITGSFNLLREFMGGGKVPFGKNELLLRRFTLVNYRHPPDLEILTLIQYRKAFCNFTFAVRQAPIADRCDIADEIIAVHYCWHAI